MAKKITVYPRKTGGRSSAKKPPQYTVSDGGLVLTLEPAEDGWYVVTSPLDPELTTQAKTIEEAFEMARDALELLNAGRLEYRRTGPAENKSEKSSRFGV
jgi:predicted RNase H-like HicB family nuclease